MFYRRFKLKNNSGLYFPLFNEVGLKSTITPNLLGSIKYDYHHYLTEPISEIGLYESYGRHVIFLIDDVFYYLSGKGVNQQDDEVVVTYGANNQHVIRTNDKYVINVLSFVTYNKLEELHKVTYKNITNKLQKIKIITAPLVYGRSLDNLFDHRHVTSLLNRSEVINGGIKLKPTLSFDERGHLENDFSYYFLTNSPNLEIDGYYPKYDDFINGGSMLYPKGLNKKYRVGDNVDGYEVLGGVGHKEISLKPNEEITFFMSFNILKDDIEEMPHANNLVEEKFNKKLEETILNHNKNYRKMQFEIGDEDLTNYLSYIELQPVLRRLFGNSYLPHHDYGKGGRGWRDLFQDLLFMIMTFDKSVRTLLINNFKGVRIDGSNATIIGNQPGEFKADRNNITRVWSDHAAWPLLTIDSYINYFNDYKILDEEATYFDDQFTHYTKRTKQAYSSDNILKVKEKDYKGTILEHLLLQNVVSINNLGENGFVRIEDADWNDGLDMASKFGETVAFTHFYIKNIQVLIKYLERYRTITLFKSLGDLIETGNLEAFFNSVSNFNDEKLTYRAKDLIDKLNESINKLLTNIDNKAHMDNGALQSYIDNDGNWLDHNTVSLTGQAMALLSETVNQEIATKIAKITKEKLYEENIGGYHLNQDYGKIKMNMGRAYGFRYNHKENGAVFSHMALMYAYGLYNYKLQRLGYEATFSIVNLAKDLKSKTPLGIPEYFTEEGVGKYFYLTGSATWLLKVLREQIYGLKMVAGILTIDPQMEAEMFINGSAKLKTIIFGKLIDVIIYEPDLKDSAKYTLDRVLVDGILSNNKITKVDSRIEVYLK